MWTVIWHRGGGAALQYVPGVEVLLHTLVVLDLGRDRNGHSLTACKSNKPGPWRREECRSVFIEV